MCTDPCTVILVISVICSTVVSGPSLMDLCVRDAVGLFLSSLFFSFSFLDRDVWASVFR